LAQQAYRKEFHNWLKAELIIMTFGSHQPGIGSSFGKYGEKDEEEMYYTTYVDAFGNRRKILTTDTIEGYKEKFREYGLPTPEPPQKEPSLLKKIFGLLQRGETAPAVMAAIKGEDPVATYLESTFGPEPEEARVSYSDVLTELGWDPTNSIEKGAKFLAGLALDIVLDPKTYLTFGASAFTDDAVDVLAKTTDEVGEKLTQQAISAGQELGDDLLLTINNIAEETAKRKLATKIAMEGGKKYIKKAGLRFMGQTILPKDAIESALGGLRRVAEATPGLNKILKLSDGFIEASKRAFQPLYDLSKLPTPEANVLKYFRNVPGDVTNSLMKKYGDDLGRLFTKEGGPYEFFRFMPKKIRARQEAVVNEIKEYAQKIQNLPGDKKQAIIKKLANKLAKERAPYGGEAAALIERELTKDVDKTGKITGILSELFERGEKTGFKEVDDIFEIYTKRAGKWGEEEMMRGLLKGKIDSPYLRHSLTDEAKQFILGKKGDFLGGLPKPLRAKLRGAEKLRKLEGTIGDINRWSEKALGFKFFEPDFFKNWATREIDHISAIMTDDFLREAGERFGKSGIPIEKVYTKAGKKIKEKVYEPFTENGIRYITSRAPQLKGVYFPEAIAKQIDKTMDVLTSDKSINEVLKLYDRALRFWKGTVTGIWPAFHTRNFFGGSTTNFFEGVKLQDIIDNEKLLRGVDEIFTTKLGKKITYREAREQALKHGIFGQPGIMDTMEDIKDLVKAGKLRTKSKHIPQLLMEMVENRLRGPLFLRRLKEGDSVVEAAKRVFQCHFDYAPEGLTTLEKGLKRIFPFYTWFRHNIPLQLSYALKKPGKFAALAKTQREWNKLTPSSGEEFKYMPQWMSEMFLFRIPGKERQYYLQLDLPIDDIAKLPITESGRREIFAMLSPVLKYPIEMIGNRNIYFGSDIWDEELPPHLQTSRTLPEFRNLPEPIKKWLNFREGIKKNYRTGEYEPIYEMDSKKLHAIRSFLGRFYSTFDQILEAEDPWWKKLARIGVGVPVRDLELEEQKYQQLKDYERILREVSTYYKQRKMMPYAGEELFFEQEQQPVKGFSKWKIIEEEEEKK